MRLQDGKSGNRPAARMRFEKRRAKLEGAVKSWHPRATPYPGMSPQDAYRRLQQIIGRFISLFPIVFYNEKRNCNV